MIRWQDRANNFFKDKFSPVAMNALFDSIERFLSNEKTDRKQTYLLDILLLLDWKTQNDIMAFLSSSAFTIINIDTYVIKFKKSHMSSSNQTINKLKELGYLFNDKILDINETANLDKVKDMEINVVIMDDFSGTGTTFWDAIEKIVAITKINLTIMVYAWTEVAIKNLNIKCSSHSNILSFRIVKSDFLAKRFNTILKGDLLEYVESISTKIISLSSRYGYKNSGTMIVLDGLSPNNNLPMFWNNDLYIYDNKWEPLLNREFKQEIIQKFRDIVFNKYKKDFFDNYKKSNVTDINLKEYQFCYILSSFKYNSKSFFKINFGYDTEDVIDKMLTSLVSKKMIKAVSEHYEIIDTNLLKSIKHIDNLILQDILSLIRNDAKNVSFEFVGKRNFVYNNFSDDLS